MSDQSMKNQKTLDVDTTWRLGIEPYRLHDALKDTHSYDKDVFVV